MDPKSATDVADVSALAEPARRALYSYVVAQADPVSREQAAAGCGLPVHSAKFHLDRLVDVGLLAVEFRRLSGRTGPGAGRASKLYLRAGRPGARGAPRRSPPGRRGRGRPRPRRGATPGPPPPPPRPSSGPCPGAC